ncbi:MAG: DUF362 domain-containing protein [Myxococcales bacterium]|nr:DUF362 domain-containing protein [Myxococcales bacterium]
MKITRREMLQGMIAAAAAAQVPLVAQAAPPVIGFKGEPSAVVRQLIEKLGGMSKFVSKGDKVVIKPNMGFASVPSHGATTDPIVVRTLAELALAAGAKSIQVLDNPVHPIIACEARTTFRKELGTLHDVTVQWVNDDKFFAPVAIPRGRQLKKAAVLRPVLDCDCLINVPTAKSHGGALVSFSMKNWMGVVKNRREWHGDFDLHQAIADFSTFIKPKLIILDATRVLASGGPGGPGEVKVLQTVYGGFDPVAIDSVAVTLSDWNGKKLKPLDVPHIRFAVEMGVGQLYQAAVETPLVYA